MILVNQCYYDVDVLKINFTPGEWSKFLAAQCFKKA